MASFPCVNQSKGGAVALKALVSQAVVIQSLLLNVLGERGQSDLRAPSSKDIFSSVSFLQERWWRMSSGSPQREKKQNVGSRAVELDLKLSHFLDTEWISGR